MPLMVLLYRPIEQEPDRSHFRAASASASSPIIFFFGLPSYQPAPKRARHTVMRRGAEGPAACHPPGVCLHPLMLCDTSWSPVCFGLRLVILASAGPFPIRDCVEPSERRVAVCGHRGIQHLCGGGGGGASPNRSFPRDGLPRTAAAAVAAVVATAAYAATAGRPRSAHRHRSGPGGLTDWWQRGCLGVARRPK